ncbi:MAG TPA: ABC transporter permease [bacterium]|nr:ABC transporter permease [bacterium]HPP86518.1 ABC transporter permease [bacterium]
MLIEELFMTSVRGIIANKLRSFLTMLGIIIGVASVITMLALGEGAKLKVSNSIKQLGTNLLFISPGISRRGPIRMSNVQTLTFEDAEAIKSEIPYVDNIAPENSRNYQIKYFNKNTNAPVYGTIPSYEYVRNFKTIDGRFINDNDLKTMKRVCIIGQTVKNELFGEAFSPIGQEIKIKGITFEIIGLLEEKGQSNFGDNDNIIIVPLTTFQKRLAGVSHIQNISVKIISENLMSEAEKLIEELLRKRHKIKQGAENDFTIRNQAEFLETMNEITKTFTYLLAGVATVSLIVGGIGIMNIMLVSVTERTREIGIRKAIGATKKNILFQFLLESIIVSVTGGILGIALGYGFSFLASKLTEFDTYITIDSILISFLFSVSIGLFFGIYPANKAAKLSPIEALRYE